MEISERFSPFGITWSWEVSCGPVSWSWFSHLRGTALMPGWSTKSLSSTWLLYLICWTCSSCVVHWEDSASVGGSPAEAGGGCVSLLSMTNVLLSCLWVLDLYQDALILEICAGACVCVCVCLCVCVDEAIRCAAAASNSPAYLWLPLLQLLLLLLLLELRGKMT